MKKVITLILLTFLTACGHTSALRNAKQPEKQVSLHKYDHVVVKDFRDGVSKTGKDPHVIKTGKEFANSISEKLKEKKIFKTVERNKVNTKEKCFIIDGKITETDEGNAAARLLVGAGRSKFKADVDVKGSDCKDKIASIDVDKKSWALGGAIAASQDVNSHMDSASNTIADEIEQAKKQ